jgi:hypothetical protein
MITPDISPKKEKAGGVPGSLSNRYSVMSLLAGESTRRWPSEY